MNQAQGQEQNGSEQEQENIQNMFMIAQEKVLVATTLQLKNQSQQWQDIPNVVEFHKC